ncbi:hypothetical protein PIIN_10337 [Serendipita indica DSM 11827]|uniref:Uncharacterized protein n=1 Tax=Serendipita indica (strain DSM 11827) TaxID=1109443 RepID=G4TYE9_SERID|nr:hypothetical protein PIIN_10337 [Serendipita indica DSM 11827]
MHNFSNLKMLAIAKNILASLALIGEKECCLVGGLATYMCRQIRKANDIAIVVVNPQADGRVIRNLLCIAFPGSFFLVKPKDPNATWKNLRHRASLDPG